MEKPITIGEDVPLKERHIIEYEGKCRKCGFITKFRQIEIYTSFDKCYLEERR